MKPMDSCFSIFLLLLIFILPNSSVAQTNGTIPVGTSLTATQNSTPWISPSHDFAFGFQFIQQSGLFLLSIWYNNLHEKTIVWNPVGGNLVPSGSRLDLNAQLGLVLTDPQGTQIWSSDLKNRAPTVDHGFINDTGNFVLIGSDDSTSLWESFENPSDTLLPSQKLEINGVVESRISDTNFSRGRFQFRMLADGNAVLNPRNEVSESDYDAYYRSNTYDASNSSNSGHQVIFQETGHIIIIRRNGQSRDLTADMMTQSGEFYYRATLNFDGVFVIYSHPKSPDSQQKWTAIWTKPDNICLNIFGNVGSGACGYNSICDIDINRRPYCECPLGYSLLDPNNKYGSCKQSFVESCGENGQDLYSLEELRDIDWPLNDYAHMSPFSEVDCRNACMNDCFCAVAIYRANSCWKKKLPLSNGRKDPSLNAKAFLKFRNMDNGNHTRPSIKKRDITGLVRGLIASLSVLVVALLVLGFGLWKKKKKREELGANEFMENEFEMVSGQQELEVVVSMDNELEKCGGPKKFLYTELMCATNNFAEKDKLGEGGFGGVYKGLLRDSNTYVAVKRVSSTSRQGIKEYMSEVKTISRLGHRNLVRLIGWCHEKGELLLVYEFMGNGSLDSHIFNGKSLLTWETRFKIAQGIASALLYLHEEWEQCVVHRDIKSSNIMLDTSFNAKLGDFGLARLVDHGKDGQTTDVAGTMGYMAPEYIESGKASKESDIFSFGVVALEIACGRKPIDFKAQESQIKMVEWVWNLYGTRKLLDAADPKMGSEYDDQEIKRLMIVGLWCAHPDLKLRPSISHAIHVLNGEAPLPDLPSKMPVATYFAPPTSFSSLAFSESSQVNSLSMKCSPATTSPPPSSSLLYTNQVNF